MLFWACSTRTGRIFYGRPTNSRTPRPSYLAGSRTSARGPRACDWESGTAAGWIGVRNHETLPRWPLGANTSEPDPDQPTEDLSHVPAPTNLKVAAQGANTSEPDPDQPTEEGRKEEAGSLKRTKVDCGTVLRESTCRDPVSLFELPWPHSSWPSVLLRPHVRLCRGPRDGR